MNIEFLTEYSIPVVIGICLCVGYILKNVVTSNNVNKYIPLIMGVLGVALNMWINAGVNPTILLGGLFSGLTSTGLHQAFTQLVNKGSRDKKGN